MSTGHRSDHFVAHTPSVQQLNIFRSVFSALWSFLPRFFGYGAQMAQFDLGEHDSGKKTIVLDLDETLIHSCSKEPAHYDFSIHFRDDGQMYRMYIQKRPGVDCFLKELSKTFEICIFTASTKEYADPIIDKLPVFIPYSHRFYRHHCTIKSGLYLKDLSRFNRPISSILLIDNSPVSIKLQPQNGILCKTWTGGRNDRELTARLLPTLFRLQHSEDVRKELAITA